MCGEVESINMEIWINNITIISNDSSLYIHAAAETRAPAVFETLVEEVGFVVFYVFVIFVCVFFYFIG
jgi:hypothetical protein